MERKDDNEDVQKARAILQRNLLDEFAEHFNLKNDAAVARKIEVQPPVISKWASGILAIGATHIIRMHEMTGWSTTQIKQRLNLSIAKRCEATK